MIRNADRHPRPSAPKRRAGAAAPRPAEASSPADGILRLQRTVGNAAVQRLLAQRSASGAPGSVSPEVEEGIAGARGGGAALDSSVRGEMETAFGADFGGVRVHTGGSADTLNRALGARAFTTGADVFFRSGEFSPSSPGGKRLLAHELAHVVQQGGSSAPVQRSSLALGPPDDAYEREAEAVADAVAAGKGGTVAVDASAAGAVQRDLAKDPPGRTAEPAALTDEQVQDAIRFNDVVYNERSTRIIQDVIGATVTGVFDADTIHMVTEWQADFRLTVDGKIGIGTLKTICQEMIAEGMRDEVIRLIVDGHGMPTAGLVRISFDRTVAANAVTGGPIPGDSTVRIGPAGFAQGYEGLVHTIRHELEHVQQRRAGMANQNLREFLAEGVEIMSVGMLQEGFAGFMDDAGRAIFHWNRLSAAEQAANRARFDEMRGQVRRRFNAATAAQQAANQATMNAWDAVP